jgi:hypothetical protein
MGREKPQPDDRRMIEHKAENTNAVQVLHRDLSTQSQLGMLLAVTQAMAQPLSIAAKMRDEDEDAEPSMTEWEIAAENTFCNACEKIDKIIADERRWGIKYQERLEALFERNTKMAQQVAEEQAKLYAITAEREAAQKEAVKEASSPHNTFRPVLFQTSEGVWIACLGGPNIEQASILGSGASPAAALKAFDAAFNGGLTEEQARLIDNIKNENKSLDKSRTEPVGEDDQRRSDESADSRNAGA